MSIKRLLLGASLATLFAFSLPGQAATEMLDQVVAVVDDDIIMASELRERLAGVTQNLEARGVEAPPEDVLIRETLDRLILESIQVQKGVRVGIRISDAQLNEAMQPVEHVASLLDPRCYVDGVYCPPPSQPPPPSSSLPPRQSTACYTPCSRSHLRRAAARSQPLKNM